MLAQATLSHEGRGKNDEASQISDETIATLPDWAGAEQTSSMATCRSTASRGVAA
jgi:hypothetical protein